MDEYENNDVCGECAYFSSVHPYEEGACLRKVSVKDRKGRLTFQRVQAQANACSDFSLFQRRNDQNAFMERLGGDDE